MESGEFGIVMSMCSFDQVFCLFLYEFLFINSCFFVDFSLFFPCISLFLFINPCFAFFVEFSWYCNLYVFVLT